MKRAATVGLELFIYELIFIIRPCQGLLGAPLLNQINFSSSRDTQELVQSIFNQSTLLSRSSDQISVSIFPSVIWLACDVEPHGGCEDNRMFSEIASKSFIYIMKCVVMQKI